MAIEKDVLQQRLARASACTKRVRRAFCGLNVGEESIIGI